MPAYTPPVKLTASDWHPAWYVHPTLGTKTKVQVTHSMTRLIEGETYTWTRVTQRTNLPPNLTPGAKFFCADRNLQPREGN